MMRNRDRARGRSGGVFPADGFSEKRGTEGFAAFIAPRMEGKQRRLGKPGVLMIFIPCGLFFGAAFGFVCKAVMLLDPLIRWTIAAYLVFFATGAGFIITFNKAEREHELLLSRYENEP